MRISIFGMGYVGVVSAACLLRDGHTVIGVDPVSAKVNDLAAGRSPVQEPGVPELLAAGHGHGRLLATSDPAAALEGCDMVWICVGTPSTNDGGIVLDHVRAAAGEIGAAIKATGARPLVVLRSTVLPGTTRNLLGPAIEEHSGLTVGRDIQVLFHPEFLREASGVKDFDDPPKIVIGESHPGAADALLEVYKSYPGPRFRLSFEEAEMVKYCDNLFHALKITFANEVGAVCRSQGIDARRVAEVYCADTKLNISTRYLHPGFAFGGSCLPKDLRAMLHLASRHSVPLPMLAGVLESNRLQMEDLVARVLTAGAKTVGMVGLAFKPGTDDMRESPFVRVAEQLIGKGVRLRIYDPGVQPDRLIGANRQAVITALGHLQELLVPTPDELLPADLVLINHATVDAARVEAWLQAGARVVDLAGIAGIDAHRQGYEGISW